MWKAGTAISKRVHLCVLSVWCDRAVNVLDKENLDHRTLSKAILGNLVLPGLKRFNQHAVAWKMKPFTITGSQSVLDKVTKTALNSWLKKLT